MNLLPFVPKLTFFERRVLIDILNRTSRTYQEEPEIWFTNKTNAVRKIKLHIKENSPLFRRSYSSSIRDTSYLNILWLLSPKSLSTYKRRIANKGNKLFGITPLNKR
jgi:hypothetical protein